MARDTTSGRAGVSLAKGPVGIVGLIGILYGISALIFASHGFGLHIPHGAVHGKKWIGLEVNGWSELLFIAAGLLLLFSAPLHWGAKSMSLLVGLVMIAAAVVAVIRGDGVFGILAADHLTELVWGAAGVLLLVLALLPRVGDGGNDREEREPEGARVRSGRSSSSRGRTPGTTPLVDTRDSALDEARPVSRHARRPEGAAEQDRPPDAGAETR